MEDIIKKDQQKLEILAAMRSENLVELTLDRICDTVEDKGRDIDAIIQSIPKRKEMEASVLNFISFYLVELFTGNIITREYVERGKSKQEMYVYVGTHWKVIPSQLYFVACKKMCKKMGLPDILCEDPKFMCQLFEKLAFMVIGVMDQTVPQDECWLNLANGTLVLKEDGSFMLRNHQKTDFFVYALDYAYSPDADCPLFMKFINRVLPDKATQDVVAEYIGYCFSKISLSRMLCAYGTGSNGKSVLFDVISNLLGTQNVSNITLSALTTDDEKRCHIEGKLANISYESRGDLDTAVLKQLISGEPTEVRKLYVGSYQIKDIPKLFTSYNKLPLAELTYGFFRRWILVPFKVTIPEEEQDPDLVKKLNTELSGILNWVLVGLKRLMDKKTFTQSEVCRRALSEYINNSNSVMQFVDQMCVIDDKCFNSVPEMYRQYVKFCAEEDLKKYAKKNFKEIVLNFGVKSKSIHNQICLGIRLKREDEQ